MFGWWQARKENRAARSQLERLSAALEIPPGQRDVSRIYPIILPAEALENEWPGPIISIYETACALGWAEVRDGNFWSYVSHEMADLWEQDDVDWRRVAFQNLKAVSTPGANGEKLDERGSPFIKVMIQDDAFGPSRLLIPHLFEPDLGPDYLVAIPERTCAVAFRRALTPEQESVVTGIIEGCFHDGTEPMSSSRHSAAAFWSLAENFGW